MMRRRKGTVARPSKCRTKGDVVQPRTTQLSHSRSFEEVDFLKKLFAAGARASSLGIAALDSKTRFQTGNESRARETQSPVDYHIGKPRMKSWATLLNKSNQLTRMF